MPIAVDFGNSSIKCGYFKEGEIHPTEVWTLPYNLVDFENAMTQYSPKESCIMSSVANSSSFENLLQKHFAATHNLSYKSVLPFANSYKTPETLGNDRMAACAGAMEICQQRPLLVVDAGSCITYDYITESDTYIGGAISPGIEMKLKAMHHFTEKLPKATFTPENERITLGKSTIDCLLAGAVTGTVHEIMGFAATFTEPKSLNVVLTGGNSEYLADQMENSTFAAPNLVLVGLNKIRQLNAH